MKFNDYLMITEAAEFLGVTPNTLRNWRKDGKINVYRHPINKYTLYKKEELEILLGMVDGTKQTRKLRLGD